MTSRVILYLAIFAICALITMATMAEAEDAGGTAVLGHEGERRSLAEALLVKRAAGDEGATNTRRGKRRRGKGKKGRGKGRGKGQGKGRKIVGDPIYESEFPKLP